MNSVARPRRGLLSLLILAAAITPALAQSQIFLEFTPLVTGEATAPGFNNQITVLSLSHGIVNPACTRSGKGSGIPSEFVFTKTVDRASLDMYNALHNRTPFSLARFRITRLVNGDPTVYQEYEFQDVLLTSASAAGTATDTRPLEAWSLSYGQLTLRYIYISSGGKADPPEVITIVPPSCVGN